MECEVIAASHLLGKKWAIPIIEEIAMKRFNGFNDFCKRVKITPRTLSYELKELEESGLVKKRAKAGQTGYDLTKKGEELHSIIEEIKKWNIKWGNTPIYCLDISCAECRTIKGIQ